MAAFNFTAFVLIPTLTQFDKCKKTDLRELTEHYNIPVSTSFANAELKAMLLDGFFSKGVISLPAFAGTLCRVAVVPRPQAALILQWRR